MSSDDVRPARDLSATNPPVQVREACAEDWEAIAALHTASWRSAYRGILTDDYLDGEAADERRRVWRGRLVEGACPAMRVFVAERNGEMVGFASVDPAAERAAQYGPRVENLHSRPDCRGQGIGRALLSRAAQWVEERETGSAMHLYVFEKNTAARSFYRHLGGAEVERISCTCRMEETCRNMYVSGPPQRT